MKVTTAAPVSWRETCLAAVGGFEGLFSDAGGLSAVFWTPGAGAELVRCGWESERSGDSGRGGEERSVGTLVDALPAAGWDERAAHDLHRIGFRGHDPLRPLLDHSAELAAWTVPVAGRDVHQVAVGPIHAGVIESGHFRFQVVGELIVHLDVRLFYKRRGLEAAAAGHSLVGGLAFAQRACAACAVANTVAYAQAAEAALGLTPDDALARERTILAELERVYNHLHDISAICAGVGFAAGTMAYAALKERAQRLNAQLSGHRFLFNSVALGAGTLTIDRPASAAARQELAAILADHNATWRSLAFARSLQDRLDGVGVLGREDAIRLGAVGPATRAAGVRRDVRSESPHLSYPGFIPARPERESGDVAARFQVRGAELEASLWLLDRLLDGALQPGRTERDGAGSQFGLGRVESPRGRTLCLLERDDDRITRLHLRTGSYANWPVVNHVVPGNLLPDFPLINKSFELCYACADR